MQPLVWVTNTNNGVHENQELVSSTISGRKMDLSVLLLPTTIIQENGKVSLTLEVNEGFFLEYWGLNFAYKHLGGTWANFFLKKSKYWCFGTSSNSSEEGRLELEGFLLNVSKIVTGKQITIEIEIVEYGSSSEIHKCSNVISSKQTGWL